MSTNCSLNLGGSRRSLRSKQMIIGGNAKKKENEMFYLVFQHRVYHVRQVFRRHLIYRASLHLCPMYELVMVNELDLSVVLFHHRLHEPSVLVIVVVLLFKVKEKQTFFCFHSHFFCLAFIYLQHA